jgi:TRAP-type C4-dicarboxylate transport system permease large subunit
LPLWRSTAKTIIVRRRLYAACAIGRVEPVAVMRPIWGYMLALVIGTIIVAAVPWISIGFLQ